MVATSLWGVSAVPAAGGRRKRGDIPDGSDAVFLAGQDCKSEN